MELEEMREERKGLREKARAIQDLVDTENREMDVQELRSFEDIMLKHDQLDARIKREERLQAAETEAVRSYHAPTRPELDEPIAAEIAGPRRFRSLGEQLLSVVRASQPGGFVDPRLLSTRAVQGMSEGSPSDGGFLVQTDFSSELMKRVYATGRLASRCRRIPISGNANSIKINAVSETSRADGSRWGGVRAYWTAEAGDKTNATPAFRQIELSLKKLTGLAYVTDELLQDAPALESLLMQAFSEEIGFKLDDAILNGTGAGMPLGIMACPALVSQAKENGQPADTIVAENIINMWSRLWSGSMSNAVWLVNQSVLPQLYSMSLAVGGGGQLVYMPANGISGRPYATLMGAEIVVCEQTDTLGDKGDIVLADLGQYLLADKGGIQSASSIHVRFVNDESVFRFVYRVDGQPWWQSALTPFNSAPTQSPFVTLDARA